MINSNNALPGDMNLPPGVTQKDTDNQPVCQLCGKSYDGETETNEPGICERCTQNEPYWRNN